MGNYAQVLSYLYAAKAATTMTTLGLRRYQSSYNKNRLFRKSSLEAATLFEEKPKKYIQV